MTESENFSCTELFHLPHAHANGPLFAPDKQSGPRAPSTAEDRRSTTNGDQNLRHYVEPTQPNNHLLSSPGCTALIKQLYPQSHNANCTTSTPVIQRGLYNSAPTVGQLLEPSGKMEHISVIIFLPITEHFKSRTNTTIRRRLVILDLQCVSFISKKGPLRVAVVLKAPPPSAPRPEGSPGDSITP
ncbi:hypothetical protein EVAR_14021_1 [Eumeta japonica]|uniref:Uncharacterized protein n=1 Tax=Eumeta variegata TaxID=151549 RepID=A0A4C1XD18_EUMVA|nr:hypothetical protein EVAR_14021_1 [Eumeta japonica]